MKDISGKGKPMSAETIKNIREILLISRSKNVIKVDFVKGVKC